MQISSALVTKTDAGLTGVQWVLSQAPGEDLADFVIAIESSESPDSGFVIFRDGLLDPVYYGAAATDVALVTLPDWDNNRGFYLRVSVRTVVAPLISLSGTVVHLFGCLDGVTDTMRYAEEMLYGFFDGIPSKIWRKRMEGNVRCAECWDPITKTIEKSYCGTCDGTGYVLGYYDSISIPIAFELGVRSSVRGTTEESVSNSYRARASNFPQIRPKDLILNSASGQRYIVVKVTTTQLPNLSTFEKKYSDRIGIVSQILDLQELATSDPEYKITH